MGCCGQKRNPLPPGVSGGASGVPHAMASAVGDRSRIGRAAVAGGRSVTLRYREHAPVHVRGPATGRLYAFSSEQPTQAVDVRDAEALLRTLHFVRA